MCDNHSAKYTLLASVNVGFLHTFYDFCTKILVSRECKSGAWSTSSYLTAIDFDDISYISFNLRSIPTMSMTLEGAYAYSFKKLVS